MAEYRIRIEIGAATDDPGAEAIARKLLAVIESLKAVDRGTWGITKHERYRWRVRAASKQSPMTFDVEGVRLSPEYPEADIPTQLLNILEYIEETEYPTRPNYFSDQVLDQIASLPSKIAGDPSPVVLSVQQIDGSARTYRPSKALESKAKQLQQDDSPADSYCVIEGLLRDVTADPRPEKEKYRLVVVERDTNREIVCHFDPSDSHRLGEHVGNAIIVHGPLGYRKGGKRPVLEVEGFHLIPQKSISIEEVHRRKLRVPGGMTPEEFIREQRADFG